MPQPAPSRFKWLIIAGGVAVAVSLAIVVMATGARERSARNAVRKESAAVMIELSADMDAAAAAMHAFNRDGGLDLTGLEDPAALDRRIDLAAKAQAAAERVLGQGDSMPQRLADKLQGVQRAQVAAATQEIPQKANWPRGREIFQTHVDAYAAAGRHLRFLKTHHGHWRVDGVGLRVDWDSQSLRAEAEKLHDEVTAAAAAQGGLSSASPPDAPAAPPSQPSSAPARD